MKILLILVAAPELDARWSVRHPVLTPPITLLLLAAICREAGHEVELIDTRFHMDRAGDGWRLDLKGLEAAVAGSQASVVGISFLSSSVADGLAVAASCRAQGKTVIGGGKHAYVSPQEFVACGNFDYLVQGEAEELFPELLRKLDEGEYPRRTGTTVVLTAGAVKNLDIVPEVVDFSYYAPVFDQYDGYRSIYVEMSRGCYKRCRFCEVSKTGSAWTGLRRIPLEKVVASIDEAVERYGVNYVIVADSIATVYRRNFIEFAGVMAESYPEVTVQFNSTVDLWNEELARACAGLKCNLWFGFESGSQRILDLLEKGTRVEQSHAAAELCRKYDIPCAFNLLLGLPGETDDDYRKTLKVLEECPWVHPNPNIFNPLPGSDLYDYCRRSGMLRDPSDYSVWDKAKIERRGTGPILGVDYGRVLEYWRIFSAMKDEPNRNLFRSF